MKLLKVLSIIILVLAVIGGAVWQFFLKDQVAFARVATAYGAKQVCSCRFVGEREMESCRGDFTQDVSQLRFAEDSQTITASVLGGTISATARFEPGLGCTLVRGG